MPSKLGLIDVCFREDATAGPTTEMGARSSPLQRLDCGMSVRKCGHANSGAPRFLDLGVLRQFQRIFDVHTQIPDGIFDLGMAQ